MTTSTTTTTQQLVENEVKMEVDDEEPTAIPVSKSISATNISAGPVENEEAVKDEVKEVAERETEESCAAISSSDMQSVSQPIIDEIPASKGN